MPLFTWDKVLRIISTILNILLSCLNSFGISPAQVDDADAGEGHS